MGDESRTSRSCAEVLLVDGVGTHVFLLLRARATKPSRGWWRTPGLCEKMSDETSHLSERLDDLLDAPADALGLRGLGHQLVQLQR